MNTGHKNLTEAKWAQLSLSEQMANVGAEVGRALNWREKQNPVLSEKAVERSLELLSLSIACARSFACRRELARTREVLVDYFYGANAYGSSALLWRHYFEPFNLAARKNR